VALTGACDSSTSTSTGSPPAATRDVKIAAVIKGLDNPFFQSMQEGIAQQARSARVSVTVQAAKSITDMTGQAEKLTALSGQDYSCYIVNPISGTNLLQGLGQLAAMKKTIVNIDRPVDSTAAITLVAPATYIGTDNIEAGAMAGRQMLALLPSGGKVATIGGISGDITSNARVKGFNDAITRKLTVIQRVYAGWNRQKAQAKATKVLADHPDLAGFFVANDDMGLGVARALANAGKTGKVKVISVDGIRDALLAVKAGQVDAVVAQYPYAIGSMAVEACQADLAGRTLPAKVNAPVQLVTKDNAAKALAVTPRPFMAYDDPFAALIR
jgi:ribose transport system substrate-binding protein